MAWYDLDYYKDYICDLHALGKSNTEIAIEVGLTFGFVTSESSVRRAFKRWERIAPTDGPIGKNDAEIHGSVQEVVTDPKTLMQEFGFEPSEWEIERATCNRYGNTVDPNYQLKVQIKRLAPVDLILPADIPTGYTSDRNFRAVGDSEAKLVVLCGDQQAPFFDENLHRIFQQWLAYNKPHEGVLIGDTLDFTEISRHRDKPEWVGTTQHCINSAYALLLDYVTSSPATFWQKLPGNHDDRIRNTIIDYNRDLFGLRRADIPGQDPEMSVFELSNLLRLEELGIEYVDPHGTYDHAQLKISSKLAARHGWIARKKSGQTAYETLEQLGFSIAVGHCHRQSIINQTKPDINGVPRTLTAAEIGCMCQLIGGLGYDPAADWQQGFMTAHVWPDGEFALTPAYYNNGSLRWANQRYE